MHARLKAEQPRCRTLFAFSIYVQRLTNLFKMTSKAFSQSRFLERDLPQEEIFQEEDRRSRKTTVYDAVAGMFTAPKVGFYLTDLCLRASICSRLYSKASHNLFH